jgi:hypothetical protein
MFHWLHFWDLSLLWWWLTIVIFWDVTFSCLVDVNRHFQRNLLPPSTVYLSTPKMKAIGHICQTTEWRAVVDSYLCGYMRHVQLKCIQGCSSLTVLGPHPSWGIHLVLHCEPHGVGQYAAQRCCQWVYLDVCASARSEALKSSRVTAYFMLLCDLQSRSKGPSVSPRSNLDRFITWFMIL